MFISIQNYQIKKESLNLDEIPMGKLFGAQADSLDVSLTNIIHWYIYLYLFIQFVIVMNTLTFDLKKNKSELIRGDYV